MLIRLSLLLTLLAFPVFAEEETPKLDLPKAEIPQDLFPNEGKRRPGSRLRPWHADAAEWAAYRTQRPGMPTDPSSKILTDGQRYDITIGNRIPLLIWGLDDGFKSWSFGLDGAMMASLSRYKKDGKLTFATETFDGMFGAFLTRTTGRWIWMARTGHVSAHLVDNSPDYLKADPLAYNVFWYELVSTFNVVSPEAKSDWDLYFQGSVGWNYVALPQANNPRSGFGATYGHQLNGPDSLALIATADVVRPGITGQKPIYSAFLGAGFLARPESTRRPFRMGVTAFRGSDHRNQYFTRRNKFAAFTIHTDF
ncbi:MAG: hypothetical protein HUU37_11325 [Bdellovibrionales bacterium]|nr:hypothetical protein [Bdellovibrionales bacterium]